MNWIWTMTIYYVKSSLIAELDSLHYYIITSLFSVFVMIMFWKLCNFERQKIEWVGCFCSVSGDVKVQVRDPVSGLRSPGDREGRKRPTWRFRTSPPVRARKLVICLSIRARAWKKESVYGVFNARERDEIWPPVEKGKFRFLQSCNWVKGGRRCLRKETLPE